VRNALAGVEQDAPEGRSAGDVTRVLGPEGGLQSSASVADAADLSMQTPAPAGTVLADTPQSEVCHLTFPLSGKGLQCLLAPC